VTTFVPLDCFSPVFAWEYNRIAGLVGRGESFFEVV